MKYALLASTLPLLVLASALPWSMGCAQPPIPQPEPVEPVKALVVPADRIDWPGSYLDGDLQFGPTVLRILPEGDFEAHLSGCMTEFHLRGTWSAEGDRIAFQTRGRETIRGEPYLDYELPEMNRTTFMECILLVPNGDLGLLKQDHFGGFKVFSLGGRAERQMFLDRWETVRPSRY